MKNRLRHYFIAVICLLGVFVTLNNLPIIHGFRPAPPPKGRQHNEKQHAKNGPAPLAMDFCISLLLIGSNLSVALFVKYIREKERNADFERNRLQQELEYLKAQLNPHFFMNMLNNIHGMVEINPPKAQEMIVELSQLMRYILYEGAKEYIPLATETDFIAAYVTLMRKRYSNKRVCINLRMPSLSQTNGILLPPLLFIVIIENAFKHGISYLQPSLFDIAMDVQDGHIYFHCCNNRSVPPESVPKKNEGIGLLNLRKRLTLLYGQNYLLEIDDKKKETYAVTLTIPYKYETDTMHSYR